MRRMTPWMAALICLVHLSCKAGVAAEPDTGTADDPPAAPTPEEPTPAPALTVTSTAFSHEADIPIEFTCDGEDVSPDMAWTEVPEGTRSVALICDDPDAPVGTWIHWVLFDMPADTTKLPRASQAGAAPGTDGKNSWKKTGYGGPCPPKGDPHRYYFKVYALDRLLELDAGATATQVSAAMEGHVAAQGTMMGKYKRAP